MTANPYGPIDPNLDLVLERVVDVPRSLVWRAWTEPQHLMPWFSPKPWTVSECQIDLRVGGECRTVMRGPEGQVMPNIGTYLDIVPMERLVFTDALTGGFRPSGGGFMTAMILLEDAGSGAKYTAIAKHADPATRIKHEEMGFQAGWGTALTQLVEYVKKTF
jgi:uncharacterized protein YndB with AHSA1/START domain